MSGDVGKGSFGGADGRNWSRGQTFVPGGDRNILAGGTLRSSRAGQGRGGSWWSGGPRGGLQ